MGSQDNYEQVTFDALSDLSPLNRYETLEVTLRKAKVRMPAKKAGWLIRDYEIVCNMGGLLAAKEALMSQPGTEAKIKFLKLFVGIGEKYARNIMMDVYHPDFRETIALDVRLTSILKVMGLSFKDYDEQEAFFLGIAHEAGLNGWELDRLIFNYRDEILNYLQ